MANPADISIKYNLIKYKYNNLFTVYTIILTTTINAIIQQHNTTLFLHFTCTIWSADWSCDNQQHCYQCTRLYTHTTQVIRTINSHRSLKPRLQDIAGCQTGCTTGLTTVKPVWQPVWQQVVSCKRGFTIPLLWTTEMSSGMCRWRKQTLHGQQTWIRNCK